MAALGLLGLLAAVPAWAEMGSDDYVRPGPAMPESVRVAPPAVAEPEPSPPPREPPADRRSPAERLVDERCGTCHGAALYARTKRTRLGWELAVARMRLVNGARIAAQERAVIVGHLTERHGAPAARAVAEWAAALGSLAALVLLGRWTWRRRGRS